MTTREFLGRHFSRMGARLHMEQAAGRQREKVRIDIGRDGRGEYFAIRCQAGVLPEVQLEVIDVRPRRRHLVLLVRDGAVKHKFLLGHDERHWFAAAVPGDHVRDVATAIESLRPAAAAGERGVVRQGEWFFVPAPGVAAHGAVIHRQEPLSRGAGSKPHVCAEMMRRGGEAVMVCRRYPLGLTLPEYAALVTGEPHLRGLDWKSMTRDAEAYARGAVRHRDHKTVYLDGWHRIYLNREHEARSAPQVAFLD